MGMSAESTADLATLLAQAGWLRRFARALVEDAAAADDLAQETMVAVLRRPALGGNRGRAWLAKVARNLAVDRFRGKTRRQQREEAAHALEHPSAAGMTSPEDLIGNVQIHREVAQTVANLAEPFRQTIVLRFYEGLTSAEIARRLDQPEGTVRWRLKEGLARVRVELDARHGDDRSAWRSALAPLLPAPRTQPARSGPSTTGPARRPETARSFPFALPVVLATAGAGVLALAIVTLPLVKATLVANRQPTSQSVSSRTQAPSNADQTPPAAPLTRTVLPDLSSLPPATAASSPVTPGRLDAQSLAEELLAAIEGNDYDAFVAKGSPAFRIALGEDRLTAANARLGTRLSRGHHVSNLGDIHRHRTIDWLFKIEFDDGGDDAVCTLAMDDWQVAGFLISDPIPNLTEK